MKNWRALSGLLTLAIVVGGLPAAEKAERLAVGSKIEGGTSLRDLKGNRRPLRDFKDNKAIVVVFLGTECPISNLYLPSLLELEKKYRPRKAQFLAVYPNEGEDLDKVAAHAYDRNVPFPVLKDFGQKLAAAVGVDRVPSVVVLDGEFKLCYRGRIDDRYGVGFRKPKATRDDLAEALDEVLAGKKVSVPETEADGCLIDTGKKRPARKDVTYTKEVARILQKRCQACHRPDQAAPFSLLTYDDAVRHARMIREVTTQHRMPPWHADPRYGEFANDRGMTKKEIETLAAWVDAGMPKGDAKDAPKPIDWPKGWTLGEPDQVFQMPEEFEVPADGVLSYKYFTVETNFTEDRWVKTAEARPGATGVVHHIVAYILRPGQDRPFSRDGNMSVLVGWAPGDLGLTCPPDVALRVPKGSRLLFEMHYTPNGTKVKDRSAVGITFAKKPPKYELQMNSFVNESILIPPGAPHHREEATLRFRADARILSVVPHMHWRGKHYRYEAVYPDGKREVLLSVPRWDFNWQSVYQFKEPVKMPKGSRLYAVAHWDNSRNNPYNPDPEKSVRFGLQTWDEMMVGWVAFIYENPDEAAKNVPSPADRFFDRMDRDGDDVVAKDELPDRLRTLLSLGGVAVPEKMNRAEFAKFYEEMRKRLDRNRPNRDRPKDGADKKPPEKPDR